MHWRIDRENMTQGLRHSTDRVRRKLSGKKETRLKCCRSMNRDSRVPPMTTMLRIVTHRKTPEAAEIDRQREDICLQTTRFSRFLQSRASNTAKSTWRMNMMISTTIEGITRRFVSPLNESQRWSVLFSTRTTYWKPMKRPIPLETSAASRAANAQKLRKCWRYKSESSPRNLQQMKY